MSSSDRDLKLITLSQAGDLSAFGELVSSHEGWLRGWLRSQFSDWMAADDLAQDSFVTAFKKIRDFSGEGSFESWLRVIAHNHLRNYLRKKREKYIGGDLELQALLTTEGSWEGSYSNTTLSALRDCLVHVDGGSYKLLNDRYNLGKTVREMAKESGDNYSTLTMKIHRLRQSLAQCIEGKLGSEVL